MNIIYNKNYLKVSLNGKDLGGVQVKLNQLHRFTKIDDFNTIDFLTESGDQQILAATAKEVAVEVFLHLIEKKEAIHHLGGGRVQYFDLPDDLKGVDSVILSKTPILRSH